MHNSCFKRFVAVILAVTLVFGCCVSVSATDSISGDVAPTGFLLSGFWDAVVSGAIDLGGDFGQLWASKLNADVCSSSPNAAHNFEWQNSSIDGNVARRLVCSYCGATCSNTAGEIYDSYVSDIETDLGTCTLVDGGIRIYFPVTSITVTKATNVTNLSKTLGSDFSSSFTANITGSVPYPGINVFASKVAAPFACTYQGGFVLDMNNCYSKTTTTSNLMSGSAAQGVSIGPLQSYTGNWDVFYASTTGNCSVSGCYYVDVFPSTGSISDKTTSDITPASRPTSLVTGSEYTYGYIDGDNVFHMVDSGVTFVDESNNVVYNPVTNTSKTINNWSYDYSDRSYNVTTNEGDTISITYGDEYVTYVEGDTTYNYYYVINNGGSSGGDTTNTEINIIIGNIETELTAIGVSQTNITALLTSIQTVIGSGDLTIVESLEYVQSTYNQVLFIKESVAAINVKLGDTNTNLSTAIDKLISIDTSLALVSSYVLNISAHIESLDNKTDEILVYLSDSSVKVTSIVTKLTDLLTVTNESIAVNLNRTLQVLISQGASLDSIIELLTTISDAAQSAAVNTSYINVKMNTLISDVQNVAIKTEDANTRLDKIYDLLETFDLDINQTINNFYSPEDSEGISGTIKNLWSALSSFFNFIKDFFGGSSGAVSDSISAFNDSLSFWGGGTSYTYKPYQIYSYMESAGASYTNSNASVQALFAEAEKYLGYPYVWGGSSPSTSFDCSGFVCYALDNSGVYPMSRTTAQGVYNICTPITAEEAQPGDIIFFTGTYNTSDAVTHLGFYAGNGQMLHCGDPIQYASIDTAYWTSHFYAYGRLPYNNVEG